MNNSIFKPFLRFGWSALLYFATVLSAVALERNLDGGQLNVSRG